MTVNYSERPTAVAERPPTIITSIVELRRELDRRRSDDHAVGFVPTMGYLHDGHASLMERASSACDTTVASIFVNPLQFAPNEDLATYPRDLDRDRAVAATSGVDLLFVPTAEEMYPHGEVYTSVNVAELSATLEGASRPTHFSGMATVVTKLFNIIGPCRAYFGEKDFQQLAIVTRMVSDLSLPVEVIGCPIVRETDGLAMSSRNVRLLGDDRPAAAVLNRALRAGTAAIEAGERSAVGVHRIMADVVATEPRAELDYAVAVEPATLTQPDQLGPDVRLLIAARVGDIRLIDNCGVRVDPAQPMG